MSQFFDAPTAAPPQDDPRRQVLTVAQLTAQIKGTLEADFPGVWVAGEISNFSRPSSGHCYFTLKDDQAQIRAVMWRATAGKLKFDVHDGLEVVCYGAIDVYAPRGSYQLVVSKLEPRGIGALELALRKLKEKLQAEGLFDPRRKRPLPRFPRRVAFVTSPTGAAVRDFLEVVRRRWRGADILVIPTRVQGDGAAAEIAAAIERANRLEPAIDVLIVGRGGGSLEDLWCFNEEVVLRAVAASRIPTVSAVGHEIDVTLCDFVADVRALTPSEAAELVVPQFEAVGLLLEEYRRRMHASLVNRVTVARRRLAQLAERRVFRRPHDLWRDRSQRLDELWLRSRRAAKNRLERERGRVQAVAGKLRSLSPLDVLARGYSVTVREDDGRLVTEATQVTPGDRLKTRVAQAEILSRVETVRPADPTPGESTTPAQSQTKGNA